MLRLVVALSIIGILGVSSLQNDTEPVKGSRIIKGKTASIIDFKWIASIQRYGEHFCGGSVLDTLWVLTAAHCLETTRPEQASGINVRMGTSDWRSGGVLRQVKEFYMHPQYNTKTMVFDIAVIKLISPVEFSASLHPIQMATREPADGTLCTVSGWGFTNSMVAKLEYILRETDVIFRSQAVCSSSSYGYSIGVQETMICGEGDGTDSCQGDSGGPLINKQTKELVGVVSWGNDCGRKGFPGIYSNVAQLRPWVLSILRAW